MKSIIVPIFCSVSLTATLFVNGQTAVRVSEKAEADAVLRKQTLIEQLNNQGIKTKGLDETKVTASAVQAYLDSKFQSDKVNVVKFYADWCGPCRAMAPHMDAMAKDDASLNLISINVDKLDQAVAKDLGISSIPDVRVFTADGDQIGKKTSSFGMVKMNVKKAKRTMAGTAEAKAVNESATESDAATPKN